MRTNRRGRCDRRATVEEIKLCEESPDGKEDCTTPVMTLSAGKSKI